MASAAAAKPETDAVQLKVEVELLRAENVRLREENTALRKLLGTSAPKETVAPAAPTNTAAEASQDTGYWLSSNGVRHNWHCKLYKMPPGRYCKATDGKPCKKCKG